MDNAVFVAFDEFEFEKNENFKRGWASVKTLFESNAVEREYLKAKAFFFSKYIQSFDFEKYKAWKIENGEMQATNEDTKIRNIEGSSDSCNITQGSQLSTGPNSRDSSLKTDLSSISSQAVPLKENKKQTEHKGKSNCSELPKDIDQNNSCKEGKEDEDGAKEQESLSLAELAAYIQNDLPIPGLISVDVHPTNKDPTPSSMSRKSKPWELKNSDNVTDKDTMVDSVDALLTLIQFDFEALRLTAELCSNRT